MPSSEVSSSGSLGDVLEQMPLRADALLLGLLLTFYLGDSTQLLFANEAVLVRRRRGVWRAALPTGFEILGRFLMLPNPLRPDVAVLRLTWPMGRSEERCRDELEDHIEQVLKPLDPIRPLTLLLLVQLFCALPIAYVFSSSEITVLMLSLALIYANVVAMVMALLVAAPRIGLKRLRVAFHAFECLVCVPCAINLYRKLTLECTRSAFPLLDAGVLLSGIERRDFYSTLVTLTQQQLDWSPATSPAVPALLDFKAALEERLRRV